MNIDRALISRCIQTAGIAQLLERGLEERHFLYTRDETCAEIFRFLSDHVRKFDEPPSQQLVRDSFPDWQPEPSSDSLDALLERFLVHVKRRAYSSKLIELSELEKDPSRWAHLDEFLLDAARDLTALLPSGRTSKFSDMDKRTEVYERERDHPETKRSYKMGIAVFDKLTGGFRPGNLVTIAGFSGKGKSMLSQRFLMTGYDQGAKGVLLSTEMTREEIWERLDNMVMHFPSQQLAGRTLPLEKVELWKRIAKQYTAAHNDIVVIDRMSGCTLDKVYGEISRHRPDIAVVDYVQMMRTDSKYASQWQHLVDITNGLKEIALSTDTAVIMVSQDGREAAQQGSTESNMGGSISVYQAADLYIGMHQTDDMYEANRMEVRLLKSRRGRKHHQAFLDWDLEHGTIEDASDNGRSDHAAFVRNGNGNGAG